MQLNRSIVTAVGALMCCCGLSLAQDAAKEAHDCPPDCQMACCADKAADHECKEGCVKACCVDLATLIPNYEEPELAIGAKAPALELAHFYKGESIQGFKPGHIYVVEFWATWCKPCIAAFPHLSELQAEHASDVTFIGVNIWDDKGEESMAERVDRVGAFVKDQGERMGYTVAQEETGKMAEHWMKAAGRNGIPSAFIVDGSGTIAWAGHPMGMDETLNSLLDGTYDKAKAVKQGRMEAMGSAGFRAFATGLANKDEAQAKEAYQLGRAMAVQLFNEESGALNAMAWYALDNSGVKHRDYGFCKDVAHMAAEASKWKDPAVLDTYAMALFKTGDTQGAVEQQSKAIALLGDDADPEMRADMEARLEEFKNGG